MFKRLLRTLSDNRGCFGGGSSAPAPQKMEIQAAPPPAFATPQRNAEESAAALAEKKRKQLAALKYGMSSTIKTGEGTGPLNLLMPSLTGGKAKLGA